MDKEDTAQDSAWSEFVTFWWVRYFNLKDLLKTIFCYWHKPKFALVDLALLLSYFFKSPYRIAREYNDDEPYGETPLTTLDKILKACPLGPTDVAYELGSGRGRACLWLALYKGYTTIGVEYIPTFVTRAQKIAAYFGIKNVKFLREDILKTNLHAATWIYLFGSALPDDTITKLYHRLEKLKPGTRIITISYPLTAYCSNDHITLKQTLDVEFAWGKTQAFIHVVADKK